VRFFFFSPFSELFPGAPHYLLMRFYLWLALFGAVQLDPAQLEEDSLAQLLAVRRVYVDRLNGGETAAQMRDMIISSLQNARLFIVTENPDKADAVFRGSAEDLVFTDIHSSTDGINARINAGSGRNPNERDDRSRYAGASIGQQESSRLQERRHEATASVRLVNKDGDVIWSTTQESLGGKFLGSSADVADKITRRLREDYARARKKKTAVSAEPK
jgi:hypothetical protein